MKFHQEFLTILAVTRNQSNIILRLDIGDEFNFENYKQIVIEVELTECKNFEKELEELNRRIGELIWSYEFSETEKIFTILLEADASEIIFHCEKISERKDDLKIEEISLKLKWLSGNYQRISESNTQGWRKYRMLIHSLKTEVINDLNNWEVRKTFFEQNNPKQIEKAETIIKFCHKIMNFIEQSEKEEK